MILSSILDLKKKIHKKNVICLIDFFNMIAWHSVFVDWFNAYKWETGILKDNLDIELNSLKMVQSISWIMEDKKQRLFRETVESVTFSKLVIFG